MSRSLTAKHVALWSTANAVCANAAVVVFHGFVTGISHPEWVGTDRYVLFALLSAAAVVAGVFNFVYYRRAASDDWTLVTSLSGLVAVGVGLAYFFYFDEFWLFLGKEGLWLLAFVTVVGGLGQSSAAAWDVLDEN